MSGIHKENLREQREDILKAERKGAYGKGALMGVGAGVAAPTLFGILPSLMGGGDTVSDIGMRMTLEKGLFKVLKNNPDFGMTGVKDDEIREAAKLLAGQQDALPSSLKQPQMGKTFQRIRQSYPGPAGRGIQIPESITMDDMYRDAAKTLDPSWKSGRPLVVDNEKGLEAFRTLVNKAAKVNRDGLSPTNRRHMPQKPTLEHLVSRGASPDTARMLRHLSKKELMDAAVPIGKPIGSHPSAGSAGTQEISSLLNEISKRHGKVEAASQGRAFMRHADNVLKNSKTSLITGAIIGAAAGLASVRAKRQKARRLRSSR